MNWVSFGILLNENIVLYLICLLVTVVIYYLIFKKTYISLIDPLMFANVFSLFGFSVVLFLYFTKSIEAIYFYSYLLTQTAFWIGLFFYKPLKKEDVLVKTSLIKKENDDVYVKVFFLVSSISLITLQLISYYVIGIPLLLGNHVDIYNGSNGWGFLGRFIDVLKPISIFLLIHFFFNFKKNIFWFFYRYFFLLILLIFIALSASRGEFMNLAMVFFCYAILNSSINNNNLGKIRNNENKFILAGLAFVFIVIAFQGEDALGYSKFGKFLFRLVASGDIYYFAYPNHNIELLKTDQPFLALFGDIFSTLRIIPRENQPLVIGYQLFNFYGASDTVAGPNARHNVFGYAYFGFFGSIIFSFLLGLSLSFFRNKMFFKYRKNIIKQIIFVLIYLSLSSFETDPPSAIFSLENILLILPFLFLITYMIIIALNIKKVRLILYN